MRNTLDRRRTVSRTRPVAESRKLQLTVASFIVGIASMAASLGLFDRQLTNMPVVEPQSDQQTYLALAIFVALALMPILIELLFIFGFDSLKSRSVQLLTASSALYILLGWLELLRLAPRVERALTEGPGAWIIMMTVAAGSLLYVFVALVPTTALGVLFRFKAQGDRCPTSAST
jgi:predicted membrane channel-forming protein YqfA (hemolysin III family)